MKAESKVVSLETAKALQAAGFPQDTEHNYYKVVWAHFSMYAAQQGEPEWTPVEGAEPIVELDFRQDDRNGKDYQYLESWSAPDAQEIGELLPLAFILPTGTYELIIKRKENTVGGWWSVGYTGMFEVAKRNEAEARASCWLWLKEKGLV